MRGSARMSRWSPLPGDDPDFFLGRPGLRCHAAFEPEAGIVGVHLAGGAGPQEEGEWSQDLGCSCRRFRKFHFGCARVPLGAWKAGSGVCVGGCGGVRAAVTSLPMVGLTRCSGADLPCSLRCFSPALSPSPQRT